MGMVVVKHKLEHDLKTIIVEYVNETDEMAKRCAFTWRMGGSTQSKQTGHSKSEARSWFVVAPEEEVCDELLMFNSDELEVGVPDEGVLTAEEEQK